LLTCQQIHINRKHPDFEFSLSITLSLCFSLPWWPELPHVQLFLRGQCYWFFFRFAECLGVYAEVRPSPPAVARFPTVDYPSYSFLRGNLAAIPTFLVISACFFLVSPWSTCISPYDSNPVSPIDGRRYNRLIRADLP
jgi:hypothetical protein